MQNFWTYENLKSILSAIWEVEKFLGLVAIIVSTFINSYIFLWSLKRWGLLDWLPQWLYDFVFALDTEKGESIVFLTDWEFILDFIKVLLMKELHVKKLEPNDEIFLWNYNLLVYPLLWVETTQLCLV